MKRNKQSKGQTKPKQQQPDADKAKESRVQGEGDYKAARRYDKAARDYVKNADVEQAAREAQPTGPDEARELEQAEQQGRRRAKEEDRLLEHPEQVDSDDETDIENDNGKPPR
jgi:hypothetical protein